MGSQPGIHPRCLPSLAGCVMCVEGCTCVCEVWRGVHVCVRCGGVYKCMCVCVCVCVCGEVCVRCVGDCIVTVNVSSQPPNHI